MDFLTAENDCKWGFAEPEYYGCTKTLEFAESCNMDFRSRGFVAKALFAILSAFQVPCSDLRR